MGLEEFTMNMEKVRADFPILKRKVTGGSLVYLDNAATTQKPLSVIDAERDYYLGYNSNVGRSVHALSAEANKAYEGARAAVQRFIGAGSTREVVFTRGATESINAIAMTFGRQVVSAGDEVIVSQLEHHSNLIPWQTLCAQQGAILKTVPCTARGGFDFDAFLSLLSSKTKLVSVAHVSNVLGTVLPVVEIVRECKQRAIPTVVDGAQAVAHLPVDVKALDCDFYVFSGHKMYAPMGIGVLYGKEERLQTMPQFMTGGGGVMGVTFSEVTRCKPLPFRLESGTPNVGGAIGLGAAIEYLTALGREDIWAHGQTLRRYAMDKLSAIAGVRLVGEAPVACGLVSFMVDGYHAHDIGAFADSRGIAISAGAHCAMPLLDALGIVATARASFGLYNTQADIDALCDAVAATPKGHWSLEKPRDRF
jgi:cysteine desulfurase/selenocysteine lyase